MGDCWQNFFMFFCKKVLRISRFSLFESDFRFTGCYFYPHFCRLGVEKQKGRVIGMTRKSIGQFMAALRKANGMTQREVADRLNVSDKAVSRWERDECAPDLSLIPAIAEMYGVTCDELLKGERILKETQTDNSEPKIDKKVDRQLKALVNRSLSSFKTLIWISLALAFVGFICMFGISYGFYRPTVGFAVMLLFETVAFMMAAIAVNKLKEKKTDNELFENADELLVQKFNNTLGKFSFGAFFLIISVVVISLPLICANTTDILYAVPTVSYFLSCSVFSVMFLIFLFLKGKEPYIVWIIGQKVEEGFLAENELLSEIPSICNNELDLDGKKVLRRMNFLQWSTVILASILFVISPWFENANPYVTSYVPIWLNIVGLVLLALDVFLFGLFMIKCRTIRRHLVISGIRNVLLIGSALLCSMWHNVGWSSFTMVGGELVDYERYDTWMNEYFYMALGLALLLVLVFAVIDMVRKKDER